jgi:hypothetical protein
MMSNNHGVSEDRLLAPGTRFVLFGLRPNLASHLERSPLSHSHGYASADDSSTCFASFTLIPESFMRYAG